MIHVVFRGVLQHVSSQYTLHLYAIVSKILNFFFFWRGKCQLNFMSKSGFKHNLCTTLPISLCMSHGFDLTIFRFQRMFVNFSSLYCVNFPIMCVLYFANVCVSRSCLLVFSCSCSLFLWYFQLSCFTLCTWQFDSHNATWISDHSMVKCT